MHLNVTIKNVSWPYFSWPTLYIFCVLSEILPPSEIWQRELSTRARNKGIEECQMSR